MNNEEKIFQMLEGINKRLDRMDGRLDSMDGRLDSVETLAQRTAVLLETDVTKQLQLLYEGHKTILETLAPKARVEALEEEVDTLKTVVRLLTHDVAELKKAQ